MRMPTHRSMIRPVVIVAALVALTLQVVAQERDRAKIDDKYKWNLADIYPTTAAWRAAKDKLHSRAAQAPASSRASFSRRRRRWPTRSTRSTPFDKELSRLYTYAGMLADQDTRELRAPGHAAGDDAARGGVRRGGVVLRAGGAPKPGGRRRDVHLQAEPRLKIYRFYLEDIARRAAHTLSDAEEKLLADVGPLAGSPSNVYSILAERRLPVSRR